MTVDIEDVFLLFGKVCIVYCLYSLTSNTEDLFCMKSYIRIVWHIILNAIVCIFWKKNLSCFNALCSNCQYNFLEMVSERFIKIKNDYSSSTKNVY